MDFKTETTQLKADLHNMAYSLHNAPQSAYVTSTQQPSHTGAWIGNLILILFLVLVFLSAIYGNRKKKKPSLLPAKTDVFSERLEAFPLILFVILVPIASMFVLNTRSIALRGLFCTILLLPLLVRILTHFIFIPMGWVKTTYYALRCTTLRFKRADRAVLEAARALLRQHNIRESCAQFVEQRILAVRYCRADTLAAFALLAQARGDLPRARRFFMALRQETIIFKAFPWNTKKKMVSWLIADALSEGRLHDIATLSEQTIGFGQLSTIRLQFLVSWARWVQDPTAKNTAKLKHHAFVQFVFSWHWIRLWPFLRSIQKGQKSILVPTQTVAPWGSLHGLNAIVQKYDDKQLQENIQRRALVLGSNDVFDWISQWESALVGIVTQHVLENNIPWHTPLFSEHPLLKKVASRARQTCLADFESQCASLAARLEAKRALPIVLEWEEWISLREAYEHTETLGGSEAQGSVWRTFHEVACDHAIWLSNQRKEPLLAHAIFDCLRSEAIKQEDARLIQQETRNASISASKANALFEFKLGSIW